MTLESDVQRSIRQALGLVPGLACWRNNTGVYFDKRNVPIRYGLCVGSSDLIGLYQGRFLALEVKRPGGKLSPDQERFLALVTKLGGVAAVVHSAEEALACISR